MIELAQKKMPNAHLYQGDFSKGLVESLLQHTYDFIIATYSLHHLTDDEKIQFIQLLKEGGSDRRCSISNKIRFRKMS